MWSYERAQSHTTQSYLEGLRYPRQASGPIEAYDDGALVGNFQDYSFPGGVGREYALLLADNPDSPMIMLFVTDTAYRLDATARQIIGSLRVELSTSDL